MGNRSQFISASEAWRYHFPMLSLDTVERMFASGLFKSAHKPGGKKRSHWYALKSEVREYHANSTLKPNYEE